LTEVVSGMGRNFFPCSHGKWDTLPLTRRTDPSSKNLWEKKRPFFCVSFEAFGQFLSKKEAVRRCKPKFFLLVREVAFFDVQAFAALRRIASSRVLIEVLCIWLMVGDLAGSVFPFSSFVRFLSLCRGSLSQHTTSLPALDPRRTPAKFFRNVFRWRGPLFCSLAQDFPLPVALWRSGRVLCLGGDASYGKRPFRTKILMSLCRASRSLRRPRRFSDTSVGVGIFEGDEILRRLSARRRPPPSPSP